MSALCIKNVFRDNKVTKVILVIMDIRCIRVLISGVPFIGIIHEYITVYLSYNQCAKRQN
jgi:hypothetical protein